MEAHVKGGTGRETYIQFLEELRQSWLIIPLQKVITKDPETGAAKVPMLVQKTTDGKRVLSVYTDDEAFNTLKANAPALAELRCMDAFGLAMQVQIEIVIVNTGSPCAVAIDKRYFEALAQGKAPTVD